MMFAVIGALALLLLHGAVANPKVHDAAFQPGYVLEAAAANITINCEQRHSVTFNGTFPGPTLYLREGEVTWVRVYNHMLDQNLTVHWHGLSQRTAPFSDGTPLVSQWPIPPNRYFDYEIRPEIGDAGTYYYHSHVGFQMSTAHGALIVLDKDEPQYKYDGERTLMLADYYAKEDHTIETGLLAEPFVWSGEPQAITIQGKSGKSGDGNATDPSCAPHIIKVCPSKEYRIRVIGATVLSMVKMNIQDHGGLEVIEADGQYTERAGIDHIQITSGQRYSFTLKTKSAEDIRQQKRSQFWIQYESRERPETITGYALLKYCLSCDDKDAENESCGEEEPTLRGLPCEAPFKLPDDTTNYLDYTLQPKSEETRKKFPRLSEVTRTVSIVVNQNLITGNYVDGKLNGALVWEQNNNTWKEDVQAAKSPVPYLVDAYQCKRLPNYTRALENEKNPGFDPVTNMFVAKIDEVLDIVWLNNASITGNYDVHPMHIHGEHAWDLGSGDGTYNAEENEKRFANYTPALRDTTLLPRFAKKGEPGTIRGWRAWRIRITAENVGFWMMHCHIAQHSVMGMNTVWAFDPEALLSKFQRTPYEGYLKYGSSAYGKQDLFPKVVEYFGTRDEPQSEAGLTC